MRDNNSLFIVDSPFQCLCMLEAIDFFKLSEVDIIITYSNNHSLEKVDRLLSQKGLKYQKLWLSHLLYDTVPLFFKRHKHYRRIFVGNYCSPHGYTVGVLYATFGADICFMDDGTQVLSLFSNNPPKRHKNWKVISFMAMISLLHKLKRIKKDSFFTMFDVESKEYNIIHNQFLTLKASQTIIPSGVYIIGTNSSFLSFKGTTYKSLLMELFPLFSNDPIYYCPHRQDKNYNDLRDFCHNKGVTFFDTEVSVEYDFIRKSIYPRIIVGFNSNALYTLHKIFPKSECLNMAFTLNDNYLNKTHCIIRNEMEKAGIKTINI